MNVGETFQGNCPYCYTRAVGFKIEYTRNRWQELPNGDNRNREDVLAICGFCHRTVLAEFELSEYEEPELLRIFPSPSEPPEYLPESVAWYFKQGVDNLPPNYDAAAAMFRTALENGLKQKFPDGEDNNKKPFKSLDTRIKEAALTPELAEWADQIRLGGNDAVHGEEPLSKKEAQELHDFTELVLLYLFTLPEKLKQAKSRQQAKNA